MRELFEIRSSKFRGTYYCLRCPAAAFKFESHIRSRPCVFKRTESFLDIPDGSVVNFSDARAHKRRKGRCRSVFENTLQYRKSRPSSRNFLRDFDTEKGSADST